MNSDDAAIENRKQARNRKIKQRFNQLAKKDVEFAIQEIAKEFGLSEGTIENIIFERK